MYAPGGIEKMMGAKFDGNAKYSASVDCIASVRVIAKPSIANASQARNDE
jgi:hypothetical protein